MAFSPRLSDLCELVVDCPHSTPVWTESGTTVLRSHNIRKGRLDLSNASFTDEVHYLGRVKRAVPRSGDIVITREAPMGEVCMLPEGLRCCLGQRMVLLRPDPQKVHGRFLLYALQSPTVQHLIHANDGTGSTVSNLRIPLLESLEIPIPSRVDQQFIGEILGSIDDKIDLLKQANSTLESIAQAIFKSWFVDFDPVKAKAEGREPEGMDAATAALFPSTFEDSEFGPIPQGWQRKAIHDLGEVVCGKTPPTKVLDYYGEDVPFITIPDLHDTAIVIETERKLTRKGAEFQRGKYLPRRSVCVSCIATPGLVALTSEPSQTNQQINSIVPTGLYPASFTFFLLRGLSAQIKRSGSGGSVFENLSKGRFENLPVLLPSPEAACAFAETTSTILDRIEENSRTSTTLAKIRNTHLPKLMSGQLRVPEAEALVNA